VFYLLLPILAGVFWAVCYTFMEQSLQNVSIATWYFVGGVVSILISLLLLPKMTGSGVDIKPLLKKEIFIVLVVAIVSAKIADMSIAFALTKSPATFVAFGEISYVLFVPFVALFIFKDNQITAHTMGGGLVVFLGISILLFGQLKGKADSNALNIAQEDAPVTLAVAETGHMVD